MQFYWGVKSIAWGTESCVHFSPFCSPFVSSLLLSPSAFLFCFLGDHMVPHIAEYKSSIQSYNKLKYVYIFSTFGVLFLATGVDHSQTLD